MPGYLPAGESVPLGEMPSALLSKRLQAVKEIDPTVALTDPGLLDKETLTFHDIPTVSGTRQVEVPVSAVEEFGVRGALARRGVSKEAYEKWLQKHQGPAQKQEPSAGPQIAPPKQRPQDYLDFVRNLFGLPKWYAEPAEKLTPSGLVGVQEMADLYRSRIPRHLEPAEMASFAEGQAGALAGELAGEAAATRGAMSGAIERAGAAQQRAMGPMVPARITEAPSGTGGGALTPDERRMAVFLKANNISPALAPIYMRVATGQATPGDIAMLAGPESAMAQANYLQALGQIAQEGQRTIGQVASTYPEVQRATAPAMATTRQAAMTAALPAMLQPGEIERAGLMAYPGVLQALMGLPTALGQYVTAAMLPALAYMSQKGGFAGQQMNIRALEKMAEAQSRKQ